MVVIHAVRLSALAAGLLAACGGRTALLRLPSADGSAAEVELRARDGALVPADDLRPDVLDATRDLAPEARPDPPPEARPDTARDGVVAVIDVRPAVPDTPPEAPNAPDAPANPTPGCAPVVETCNGVDDDCDGVVDDDLAPIPCPGGGFRYCVGGQTSDCPARCAVCVPGGKRICFISYCTYWGTQTCASDGQSWGYCVEQKPVPKACAGVASDQKRSPDTEQCCIDNGFCCLDEFDLNGNGDKTEMLGRCEGVLCALPR